MKTPKVSAIVIGVCLAQMSCLRVVKDDASKHDEQQSPSISIPLPAPKMECTETVWEPGCTIVSDYEPANAPGPGWVGMVFCQHPPKWKLNPLVVDQSLVHLNKQQ